MKLSILIKALNEEALISKCLESALNEAMKYDGEVILVDSLSTDRTIEIARRYPVRIIQFVHKADCGCASAVQLGYQYARGEYLYILDGDMELQRGFLSLALNYLESNPGVAGVAGRLLDTRIKTRSDKRRASRAAALHQITEVLDLGGGGLYRRKAIESVGYLAHRWLPACEEAELGARLRASGWRLIRLPEIAVHHTGHSENNMQMLCRLWRSHRMHAYGMYLRTAFGRPWWWLSVQQAWFVFVAFVLHAAAGILSVVGVAYSETISHVLALIVAELFIWLGVTTVLAVRKKSISDALYSVLAWHCFALALVLGFVKSISSPMIPINGRELDKHKISQ
ncbi:MAG: glycosyltransferase [Nitrosomonas sp.]|nr:glycosyltransferase [Nitrosomonas sp.]